MEYFGIFAFILVLAYSSYPGKTKQLEAKIKKLERKLKGESTMSKLINDLVGKECNIKSDDILVLVGSDELKCLVMDCDDEWIKVQYTDKKSNLITKLFRIENIDEIELIG
jgi:hypothetical protein